MARKVAHLKKWQFKKGSPRTKRAARKGGRSRK